MLIFIVWLLGIIPFSICLAMLESSAQKEDGESELTNGEVYFCILLWPLVTLFFVVVFVLAFIYTALHNHGKY